MPDRRLVAARLSRRALLRGAAIGGAGLAAAALVGCGDDSASSVLSGEPEAEDRSGGVLRLGVAEAGGALPADLVYSRLVAVDPRNSRVYGDLADRAEITDDQVLRFRLRDNLRFHPPGDGGEAAPVRAEVIRLDFERRAAESQFFFTRVVAAVETPDDRSIVLRLNGPFALLFEYLGDSGTAAIRGDGASAAGTPIGTGPFVPGARSDELLQLGRHGDFHRKNRPLLDGVSIRSGREADLDRAFIDGELDVRVHADTASREAAAERTGAVTLRRSARAMRGLGLSLLGSKVSGAPDVRFVEAFQDQRVRRAISHAINRSSLIEHDAGVLAGPVGPAHGEDALPVDELRDHPLLQHNPEEARALLEAAGHAGLSFRIDAPNEPVLRDMATLVTEQLSAAGFAPALRVLPADEWQRLFASGDFDATVFQISGLSTPDLELRMHMSGGIEGNFSPWGFSDPTYDAAARAALAAPTPAERARLSQAAQRILLDQVPAMFPLVTPVEYLSLAPRVRGYEFGAFEFNRTWLSGDWRLAEG